MNPAYSFGEHYCVLKVLGAGEKELEFVDNVDLAGLLRLLTSPERDGDWLPTYFVWLRGRILARHQPMEAACRVV